MDGESLPERLAHLVISASQPKTFRHPVVSLHRLHFSLALTALTHPESHSGTTIECPEDSSPTNKIDDPSFDMRSPVGFRSIFEAFPLE